jgi:hypothetical protein
MSDLSKKSASLLSAGRDAARRARERLIGGVMDALESSAITQVGEDSLKTNGPEPPVVARLMVEIRSDGSRTVARGVLEDTVTNQSAAVRAEGTTPAQLARSLAGTLLTLPMFAAKISRNLKNAKSDD